jgi:CRP-like cAMP-binding protein
MEAQRENCVGHTVLVVADDLRIRVLAQGILAAKGERVLLANNAQDALELLTHNESPIDSVAIRAGISGYDDLQALSLRRGAQPCTFHCAVNDQSIQIEGLDSGADWESPALEAWPPRPSTAMEISTGSNMRKRERQPENAGPTTNRLLARLQRDDYDALMLDAKVVTLKFRKRLVRQDERVDAVYFPISCMVSLLVTTDGRPQVEVATVGKEGVVGASELIQGQGAMGLNVVQLPGTAVRIDASAFRSLLDGRPLMLRVIHQHMYALMRQILYGAACNRIHSMEERCARWLLMTHDRAGQDTFPLTQDFLSHMLSVRRATVNLAIGLLKKAGFIRYVRGNITVIDRAGLEATSCPCYHAIISAYNALLPALRKSSTAF